jgi:hypothetical protein
MLKRVLSALLVCLVMTFTASFALAAVTDVGMQSVATQANLVTFEAEKQLPALSIGEVSLNLVAIESEVYFGQGERRLSEINLTNSSELLVADRAIEKVGWRSSF